MSAPDGATLSWRVSDLERRINVLKPDVIAAEVAALRSEMRIIKRLLWTLIVTVLGASGSLTVTLLARLGGLG